MGRIPTLEQRAEDYAPLEERLEDFADCVVEERLEDFAPWVDDRDETILPGDAKEVLGPKPQPQYPFIVEKLGERDEIIFRRFARECRARVALSSSS